jgi:hypothetical protein
MRLLLVAILALTAGLTLAADAQTKKPPPKRPTDERSQLLLAQAQNCMKITGAQGPQDFETGPLADLRQEIRQLREQLCMQSVDIEQLQDKIDDLASEIRHP